MVDILKGIKELNLGLHISIKINSSDFEEGGNNENECVKIWKILEKEGIDSVEISGNGSSRMKIKPHVNKAYFLDCAKKVAEEVNIPIALVGGIRSRKTMQNAKYFRYYKNSNYFFIKAFKLRSWISWENAKWWYWRF